MIQHVVELSCSQTDTQTDSHEYCRNQVNYNNIICVVVLSKVKTFLPQMHAANQTLNEIINTEGHERVNMEEVSDTSQAIQMVFYYQININN